MTAPSPPLGLLRLCILLTGLSGIVAEYSLSTLAGWFLGNTVIQFTLVISLMMFAMGLGSRWSRLIGGDLLDRFIRIEILLSLLAGSSSALVHGAQGLVHWTPTLLYGMAIAVGFLIGLELPLVMRIAEKDVELKDNVSSVLEVDYIGSLLGGLLFAFVALPKLGMTWTPPLFAGLNLLVALFLYTRCRPSLAQPRRTGWAALGGVLLFGGLLTGLRPIVEYGEQLRYRDPIVLSEQSLYHRIVFTRWRDWLWFYLDARLQLSSYDEYRYHESMAHPPMALSAGQKRVLILGGGDGCLAREVLRYEGVEQVDLVDLDPVVTRLFRTEAELVALNGGALQDPRLRVIHGDAAVEIERLPEEGGFYDLVYMDFPDPSTVDLARLYSREFLQRLSRLLAPGGVLCSQATSPLFSWEAFLCIGRTFSDAGLENVRHWHTHVPTMGEWGWVMGQKAPARFPQDLDSLLTHARLPEGLKYYNAELAPALFRFGAGLAADSLQIRPNSSSTPVLYEYYGRSFWDLQ